MDNQDKVVDQLWYTWSDEGLDTIRAGFRVRAASEGLHDISSERTQRLDRYERYSLPRGVDPSTVPGYLLLRDVDPSTVPEVKKFYTYPEAPVCLSLINTGQERILVQKAYTGRDAVGRYGVFFVHLLAELYQPEDFSAKDAISLWRAPFWQTSDASLEKNRRSTHLGRINLAYLKTMRNDILFDAQYIAKFRNYLSYIIQAYLTKIPVKDEQARIPLAEEHTRKTIPQKIYIAASDNEVALLISGLTYCLPKQFVKDLTFSTFEHDVTAATTEIIGTCWLSTPNLEGNPDVAPILERLLPAQYYEGDERRPAINCYMVPAKRTPLENNPSDSKPLFFDRPFAASFAIYATEYPVLRNRKEFREYNEHFKVERFKFVYKFPDFWKLLELEKLEEIENFIEEEKEKFVRKFPAYVEILGLVELAEIRNFIEDKKQQLASQGPVFDALFEFGKLVEFGQRMADAKQLFLEQNPDFEELFDFEELLVTAERDPQLNVDTFLKLYEQRQNPSEPTIHSALEPKSELDYTNSAKLLARKGYRIKILDLALHKQGWWNGFGKAAIIKLRTDSTTRPKLARSLSLLAQDASVMGVESVKEVVAPVRGSAPKGLTAYEVAPFKILLEVMYCAAPPGSKPDMWLGFLQELLAIQKVFVFFRKYRDIYIDLWRNFGRTVVLDLYNHYGNMSNVDEILHWIAQRAVPNIVNTVREGAAFIRTTVPRDVIAYEEDTLKLLVDVMACATPPNANPEVWLSLLRELQHIRHVSDFFKQHWDIYSELMRLWVGLLPYSEKVTKLITPLLSLSWDELGDFLALDLPFEWNKKVIKSLLSSSEPGQAVVVRLAQDCHPFIVALLHNLAQDPQEWDTAGKLFDKLIANAYANKLPLLFILLDANKNNYRIGPRLLLRRSRLTAEEEAPALVHYGEQYLPLSYELSQPVLEMFSDIVRKGASRQKMYVLSSWLNSPLLSSWFSLPSSAGGNNLDMILTLAQLNVEECDEFFQKYGQTYISFYPNSLALVRLFERYAKSGGVLRLSLLNLWLDQQLDQHTLEQVLPAARLTEHENVSFLESHGRDYMSLYPGASIWYTHVWGFLNYLLTARIEVFQNTASPAEPSVREAILRFLCTPPPPLQLSLAQLMPLLCIWRDVAEFVRKPAVITEREEVSKNIGRFLNTPTILQETRANIINKLAVACIKNGLANSLGMLYLAQLTARDFLLILYKIAELIGDSTDTQQQDDTNALFVSYIECVFRYRAFFSKKETQQEFVQIYVNTLLWYTKPETFKWLNRQAKRWSEEYRHIWQNYASSRKSPLVVIKPYLFERIKLRLWWERKIALTRMKRALASQNEARIAQITTIYMTTLLSAGNQPEDNWWNEVAPALVSVNATAKTAWQQYKARCDIPSDSAAPVQRVTQLHRGKRRALLQMRLALFSKRIGRIVRIATKQVNILNEYDKKALDKWWPQINAAFAFFVACGEVQEKQETQEKAIELANRKIADLAYLHRLKLTAHEKRRVRLTRQFFADQNTQRMRDANEKEMLELLPLASMPKIEIRQRTGSPQ